MEDVCILYNVIEIFLMKKNNQDITMKAVWPFQSLNGIDIIM
jgi:hypothetical protein